MAQRRRFSAAYSSSVSPPILYNSLIIVLLLLIVGILFAYAATRPAPVPRSWSGGERALPSGLRVITVPIRDVGSYLPVMMENQETLPLTSFFYMKVTRNRINYYHRATPTTGNKAFVPTKADTEKGDLMSVVTESDGTIRLINVSQSLSMPVLFSYDTSPEGRNRLGYTTEMVLTPRGTERSPIASPSQLWTIQQDGTLTNQWFNTTAAPANSSGVFVIRGLYNPKERNTVTFVMRDRTTPLSDTLLNVELEYSTVPSSSVSPPPAPAQVATMLPESFQQRRFIQSSPLLIVLGGTPYPVNHDLIALGGGVLDVSTTSKQWGFNGSNIIRLNGVNAEMPSLLSVTPNGSLSFQRSVGAGAARWVVRKLAWNNQMMDFYVNVETERALVGFSG
jgi:hypothetical protein